MSHLLPQASICSQHCPYTPRHSKVLDVIKAIWPCFNHWENWAAPLPLPCTLEADKIQSLIRAVIDWCNLIGGEVVEGTWLIAFVCYTCCSRLAIRVHFHLVFNLGVKFSDPALPSGITLGPVLAERQWRHTNLSWPSLELIHLSTIAVTFLSKFHEEEVSSLEELQSASIHPCSFWETFTDVSLQLY